MFWFLKMLISIDNYDLIVILLLDYGIIQKINDFILMLLKTRIRTIFQSSRVSFGGENCTKVMANVFLAWWICLCIPAAFRASPVWLLLRSQSQQKCSGCLCVSLVSTALCPTCQYKTFSLCKVSSGYFWALGERAWPVL